MDLPIKKKSKIQLIQETKWVIDNYEELKEKYIKEKAFAMTMSPKEMNLDLYLDEVPIPNYPVPYIDFYTKSTYEGMLQRLQNEVELEFVAQQQTKKFPFFTITFVIILCWIIYPIMARRNKVEPTTYIDFDYSSLDLNLDMLENDVKLVLIDALKLNTQTAFNISRSMGYNAESSIKELFQQSTGGDACVFQSTEGDAVLVKWSPNIDKDIPPQERMPELISNALRLIYRTPAMCNNEKGVRIDKEQMRVLRKLRDWVVSGGKLPLSFDEKVYFAFCITSTKAYIQTTLEPKLIESTAEPTAETKKEKEDSSVFGQIIDAAYEKIKEQIKAVEEAIEADQDYRSKLVNEFVGI